MTETNPQRAYAMPGVGARFAPLDGIRGIGIVLVMAGHTLQNALGSALGSLGVNSFFVLSGFLITSLLLRERERSGTIDLRAFYVRRVRRIFPAFYTFLGIVAVLAFAGVLAIDPRTLAYDAFFVRNYAFGVPGDWWTGHTWSLAVEEQFYLIWPALLVFGGVRAGWKFIGACIVGAPLLRVGVYLVLPAYRPYIDIMLPTHVDTLMFGCALGTLVALRSPRLAGFTVERARLWTGLALLAVLLGFFLEVRFRGIYRFPIGLTLEGLASVLVVALVVVHPASAPARALGWAPLAWLGRLSYSLYLWQQMFVTPHHLNATIFGRFPLTIVATVVVAVASYYLIEQPCLRLGRKDRASRSNAGPYDAPFDTKSDASLTG